MKAIRRDVLRHWVAGTSLILVLGGASAHAATIQVRVLAEGIPLDSVVIYALPEAPVTGPTERPRSVMAQEGQEFHPDVLAVQVGTTVEFPNNDPFRHHVYSFSPAKTFELKLYGTGEMRTVTFDKEGAIALGCNIHDNMLAYIYAVPTPFFVTSESGIGTIQVPDGGYTVKVWHPHQRRAADTRKVRVAAAETAQIEIPVELKRGRTQRPRGAVDEHAY